jgi:hypothetical protein
MLQNSLSYPVVLKPDAGQRGSGVAVLRSDVELEDGLRDSDAKSIIQEHVPGVEFGVFYCRYPNANHGRIFSITEKRFPCVTGNGKNSLERLILDDPRAVCMAPFYLNHLKSRLWEVPEPGESVQLVELGSHCRGAVFLDGSWVKTDALEAAIDRISKTYDGFYFGRYDIRTSSVEDFQQGCCFKVVELNGVTSEATHIYDPKNSLLVAYQVLFAQWRIAFEIGAQNRRRHTKPTPLARLASLIFEFRRRPTLRAT